MSGVDPEEHYVTPTPAVEEIYKDMDLSCATAKAAANANLEEESLLAEGVPTVSNDEKKDNHNSDEDAFIPLHPPENDILPLPEP